MREGCKLSSAGKSSMASEKVLRKGKTSASTDGDMSGAAGTEAGNGGKVE